jgi:hypothetical protein
MGERKVEVTAPPYRRLDRRRRVRRTAGALVGAAIVLVALAVAASVLPGDEGSGRGTSGGPDRTTVPSTPAPTVSSTTTTSAPTAAETEAFCAYVVDFDEERPEAYVGSAEQVADIEGLAAVSPEEIRPRVEMFLAFLVGGGIDPGDPDSNLTDNFPPDVRDAIEDVTAYIETTC